MTAGFYVLAYLSFYYIAFPSFTYSITLEDEVMLSNNLRVKQLNVDFNDFFK